MSLADPTIGNSAPFTEHLEEGEPFILDGIRVIDGVQTSFGEGQMVALRVRGVEPELTVWGAYLVRQAQSVEQSDLGRHYCLIRKVMPQFTEREVKALVPAADVGEGPEADSPGF